MQSDSSGCLLPTEGAIELRPAARSYFQGCHLSGVTHWVLLLSLSVASIVRCHWQLSLIRTFDLDCSVSD